MKYSICEICLAEQNYKISERFACAKCSNEMHKCRLVYCFDCSAVTSLKKAVTEEVGIIIRSCGCVRKWLG